MRKKVILGLLVFGVWSLSLLPAAHARRAAALPYVADTAHSTVGFAVPVAGGIAKVQGKFSSFSVKLQYDPSDVTKSSVIATIKADSISTGIEGRDKHLRTPDFFEVEKYPEITFQSRSVTRKGKQLLATGDFTMHGVTKEITIPFTLAGDPAKLKTGGEPFGVQANITLDRRAYGIAYDNPKRPGFIGDQVEITLSLLMNPEKK